MYPFTLDQPGNPIERLLRRVRHEDNGCWTYTGYVVEATGYGNFCVGTNIYMMAHRAAYLLLVGPIPGDLTIDHTCHNRDLSCSGTESCLHRRCVNPDHLEPVTDHVNILRSPNSLAAGNARKTQCKHGHEFTPENTRHRMVQRRDGSVRPGRSCRECCRIVQRKLYAAGKIRTKQVAA